MFRLRALFLLGLFAILLVGRAFFAPAHPNPFAHVDAKSELAATTGAGDAGADEISPLKIAKVKRKFHHFPPYVPTELPDCVASLQAFGPDHPPVPSKILPSGRAGPETPPPIGRA